MMQHQPSPRGSTLLDEQTLSNLTPVLSEGRLRSIGHEPDLAPASLVAYGRAVEKAAIEAFVKSMVLIAPKDWRLVPVVPCTDMVTASYAVPGSAPLPNSMAFSHRQHAIMRAINHAPAISLDIAPRPKPEPVAYQVRRLVGQSEWENCTQELFELTRLTGRYCGYENGPECEVRALGVIALD